MDWGLHLEEAANTAAWNAGHITPGMFLAKIDEIRDFMYQAWRDAGNAASPAVEAACYPSLVGLWASVNQAASFRVPAPAGAGFPYRELMDGLRARNIVALINMGPVGSGSDNSPCTLQNWIDGMFDSGLDEFATAARSWANSAPPTLNSEVIVRFAWEANATWMPYRSGIHGNTNVIYRGAFEHLIDRIRVHNGATNVRFLYTPWADGGNLITMMPPSVDYVGFDAYSPPPWQAPDPPPPWSSVKSMQAAYKAAYDVFAPLGKSMIVGETGVAGAAQVYTDTQRSSWTGTATDFPQGSPWTGSQAAPVGGPTQVDNQMPLITDIVYFNFGNFNIEWEYPARGPKFSQGLAYRYAANQHRFPVTPPPIRFPRPGH